MADLKLDILVLNTYNKLTLGIADISTYPVSPPINNPVITITIPNGFSSVTLPFTPNSFNVFNSQLLGLSDPTSLLTPIPDGVYTLTYAVDPASINFVTKTIMRKEILQEEYHKAFMKLDMMECDGPVRKQAKEDLSSIYFFIEGSVAAANNCAIAESNKLYNQAQKMLRNFFKRNCNCHGNNFVNNFPAWELL
jgi:hypothetical protein